MKGLPRDQTLLKFVLEQYEAEGVSKLDKSKLPSLLELKYSSAADAINKFGVITSIRDAFIGFQKHLYD